MHIKDLAERAGVTIRAVRYYESRGLIHPRRATNGYRTYDDADVRVVREVRALLSLGLTAEQTHPFVECLRAGNDRADVCPASLSAYRARIVDIDINQQPAETIHLREGLGKRLASLPDEGDDRELRYVVGFTEVQRERRIVREFLAPQLCDERGNELRHGHEGDRMLFEQIRLGLRAGERHEG